MYSKRKQTALYRLKRLLLIVLLLGQMGCKKQTASHPDLDMLSTRISIRAMADENGVGHLSKSNFGSEKRAWALSGNFASLPKIKIGLSVYNIGLHKEVFHKIVTFSNDGSKPTYSATITIPTGQSEIRAYYIPQHDVDFGNAPTSPATPYYVRADGTTGSMPWSFSDEVTLPAEEEVSYQDVWRAGFPAFTSRTDKRRPLADNPVDITQTAPTEADAKVSWSTPTDLVEGQPYDPWQRCMDGVDDDSKPLNLSEMDVLPVAIFSGSTKDFFHIKKGMEQLSLTVPLYRETVRLHCFLGTANPTEGDVLVDAYAFLNLPQLSALSFRSEDTESNNNLGDATPHGSGIVSKTGVVSLGKKLHGSPLQVVPVATDGKPDYGSMERTSEKYDACILPQYCAPYIPAVNSFQATDAAKYHPALYLRVRSKSTGFVKEYIVPVGEESAPGKYMGPLYPGRDYKVWIVVPKDLEKEIQYKVAHWDTIHIDVSI